LDTTPPVVAITSPGNGDTLSYAKDGTVAIKGSVTDANPDHYYWKITGPNGYDKNQTVYDSSSFTNQTITNWNLNGLASGTYTIDLEARDAANNKGAASVQTIEVTVDNTAPSVPSAVFTADNTGNTVDNGGYTNSQDFHFALTNAPTNGVTRYKLIYWNNIPGSQFNSVNTPWAPPSLASAGHMSVLGTYTDNFTQGEGTHYFEFSACDAYDNCSSFSPQFQVTYDATDPKAPTASPAGGDYSSVQQVTLGAVDPASIDGTSGSGIASIYYTTDGTTPSKTNGNLYDSKSPIVISTDTTLKAIAYDNAGNASNSNANPVMTETYDIAPVINQISLTPTTSSVTFVWNTNEPATSRVIYDTVSHPTLGPAPNYGYAFTTPEYNQAPNKVESHSVTVTGLTPGTTYYFRVVSSGSPATVSAQYSSMTQIASTNGTP
ncbi:MAG: FN3 associated domain-containing protein, partial [Candidatus Micrarchaeaceae archaeon]